MAANYIIDYDSDDYSKLLKFEKTGLATCIVAGWNDETYPNYGGILEEINRTFGDSLSLHIKSSIKDNTGKNFTVVGIKEQAFAISDDARLKQLNGSGEVEGCLKAVFLPNSIEFIGNYAFNGNTLYYINFSDNITSIGDNAFINCRNLGKVFYGDDGITDLNNNGSIFISAPTTLGVGVFSGCTSIKYAEVGDQNHGDVDGYIEDILPDGLFSNCTNLEVCIFHRKSGDAMIGNETFNGCSKLRYVNLPLAWFVGVGDRAFKDCVKFEALNDIGPTYSEISGIIYTNTSITIGEEAFYNCNNLFHLPFSNRIGELGKRAFQFCWSLEKIDFGEYLEEISEGSFSGCASLSRIVVPNSCKRIRKNAFNGCSQLRDVFIPSSVFGTGDVNYDESGNPIINGFGEGCFSGCSKLQRLWLLATNYDNIAYSENSFYNTPEYKQLILNSNIVNADDFEALEWAYNTPWKVSAEKSAIICIPPTNINPNNHQFIVELSRNDVNSGTGTASIASMLDQTGPNAHIVYIPDTISFAGSNYNVTSIGDGAFDGNRKLANISIPQSLTKIGTRAFSSCYNLRKISGQSVDNFPVTEISMQAFANCYNLATINSASGTSKNKLHNIQSIGKEAFCGCNKLVEINLGTNMSSSLTERTFAYCDTLTVKGLNVDYQTTSTNNYYDNSTFAHTSVTLQNN